MLAGRRQGSLDENSTSSGGGGRGRRLRRQASESTRLPPPILAWQESIDHEKEAQVEVVAKKIGQPKPAAPSRPLRSPSIRTESALAISRRQVAERLRVNWSKANAKESQDKGRPNINIFLNKSFDGRPDTPKTPELGNAAYRRSQSYHECEEDERGRSRSSSSESESSSSEDETRTVLEAPPRLPPSQTQNKHHGVQGTPPGRRRAFASPSPGPGQPSQRASPSPSQQQPSQRASPSPSQQPPSQRASPSPSQQPPLQRASSSPKPSLSASARRAAFRAVGRQQPTTSSPEPRPRLMSAPPQGRPVPATERPASAPQRRSSKKSKPRRGVEGGEAVVTMVSLVSPAESEEEDESPSPAAALRCRPQTPDPPERPEPKASEPPPPILSLRRPPKAVTFRSSSVDSHEYRTSYPARPAVNILQTEETTEEVGESSGAGGGRRELQEQQQPRTAAGGAAKDSRRQQSALQAAKQSTTATGQGSRTVRVQARQRQERRQLLPSKTLPESIREEEVVSKRVEGVELSRGEAASEGPGGGESEDGGAGDGEEQTDFKSAKERECWLLFKRMSSKGVSVSFETVLRGLLTPTEYRMRRTALLAASC